MATDILVKTTQQVPAPTPAIATPAYCTTQMTWKEVTSARCWPNYSTAGGVLTPDGEVCFYATSPVPVEVTTCYPATYQPLTPVQVQQYQDAINNVGWNAGARSIASFTNDGHTTFSVPAAVAGVVVGLADSLPDYSDTDIPFGIYCSHGQAQVIENGVLRYTIGAYAAADVFTITRANGQVTYSFKGSAVYTSAFKNFNPLFLKASLYQAGDEVVNPALVDDATSHGRADLSLQALTLTGGNPYALASLALPTLTLTTHAVAAPPVVLTPATNHPLLLQPLQLSATGKSGGMGRATLHLAPLYIQQHGRAAMQMAAPTLIAAQGDLPDNGIHKYATAYNPFQLAARMTAPMLYLVEADAAARLADQWSGGLLAARDLLATVQVAGAWTGGAQVGAQALTAALFIAGINLNGMLYDGWVLNTQSSAYTRYEGWAFNAFAQMDGQYLATAADGVYVLEGDDDNGDPINASILLGKTDFRSPYKKRLPNAYFGLAASGQMVLRIFHDQDAPQTFVFSPTAALSGNRVKLAHGLESRYWQLQLANADGADFTLDSIELLPVVLSRRI